LKKSFGYHQFALTVNQLSMFVNYLKTAYRHLLKSRLFTIVNILGLTTGIASIMALSFLVYQHATTDRNQVDIDRLLYLKTYNTDGTSYTQTTYPLLRQIVNSSPEVEFATHVQQWYFPWLKYNDKEFQQPTEFVDTGYFGVFQFKFKYGNAANALKNKFSIVLSSEAADKFFGKTDPIGKVIIADDTMLLTVTGVLEHVPTNSTIRPNILLPIAILESNPDFKATADWFNDFTINYIRLRKGSEPKRLAAEVNDIVRKNYEPIQKKASVKVIPFSEISDNADIITTVIIKGSISAGVFILLIILANLINLNAATMQSRAKEVGVRQMIGGPRNGILYQFWIENGLVMFFSILLACLLFGLLLLPHLNDILKDRLGDLEFDLTQDYPLILIFLGIAFFFTILAATIPAIKLLSLKVTEAVKGRLMPGQFKGNTLRNVFIGLQFVLAITMISVTLILNRQIDFMKSASPGFDKDNVAVADMELAFRDPQAAASRFETILSDLRNNPNVKAISTNRMVPTAYWSTYNDFTDPANSKTVHLLQSTADAGYFATYQIPLLQGRYFDNRFSATEKLNIIINRTAMNAFGWTNAIGKQIRSKGDPETYTVIGVVEDFHYSDLQNKIEPMLQSYVGKQSLGNKYLSVRTPPGLEFTLMSDRVDKQYALLDGIHKVTNCIAILTIIIACMGMFGLIALFARQRVKEIGIRKALGANVGSIIKLLSLDFLMSITVAIVLATPLSWYIMYNWLQGFAYRTEIHWWMFGIAGGLALLIAILTASIQVVKAALANPISSLRSE
jgi:putative ABC transport system permease protein